MLAAMISLQAFAAVEGKWQGKLNLGTTTLSLAVRIAEGGKVAWMDSPDQMAFNIECDTLTVAANSVTVGVKRMGILISGTLSDADNSFSGSFRQGLAKLPFEMAFVSTNPYLERPQTPQPPFPYDIEEVTFSHGDVTLTGTLTKPAGKKNLTAVVLVSGSGQQNRDEEVMGHKPFAVLADHLTRGGIAVLRYDDRGTGGSSALSPDVTTADFAQDALAAVKYLQSVPEINKKKIGVVGHSEGGQIAIMLAAEHPKDVKFISTLAAPVVKGKDLMITQNEDMARMRGIEITADQRRILEQTFAAIDTIPHVNALRDRLKMLLADLPAHVRDAEIPVFTSPWYRHFIQFDPSDALKALGRNKKVAMLALNGEMDAQVDADQNLSVIESLVPHARIRRMPGLNHMFQPVDSWAKSLDIVANPHSFSPKAIAEIITFIQTLK